MGTINGLVRIYKCGHASVVHPSLSRGHPTGENKSYFENASVAFDALLAHYDDRVEFGVDLQRFDNECDDCSGKKVYVVRNPNASVGSSEISKTLIGSIIQALRNDGLKCHFAGTIDSEKELEKELFDMSLKSDEVILIVRDGMEINPMKVLFPGGPVYKLIVVDMWIGKIYQVPKMKDIGSYKK